MSYLGTRNAVALGVSQHMTLGGSNLLTTLSPTLLLQFVGAETLDPRITFTRASTATYYGTQTALAEQNLLLQSQDFTTTWLNSATTDAANVTTAPDGTTTADSITDNATNASHVIRQTVVNSIDTTYVVSCFLKAGTSNYAYLGFYDPATAQRYFCADFNLSSGTVRTSVAGTSGTLTSATITSVGSGWYRCVVIGQVSAGTSQAVVVGVSDGLTAFNSFGAIPYVGTGSDIYAWGAQLEQRSAVTAYTPTTTQTITNYIPVLQTAASGVARFDHNPITFESLGLEIEESRTNLILQSEDLDTTWAETRATLALNSVIAPSGALTADTLIASTDNDTHFTSQTFTGTAAAHTFTVYAKASGLNYVALRLFNGTSQVGLAYYNLSTGATGTVTAGTAAITSVGNGWYRCALTATLAASASCTAGIQLADADNDNSFPGNAFSGVTLWGAQVELGAFATSYIPTVASQVTRAADLAVMTGTNFSDWYNATEGTLYSEASSYDVSAARVGFGISDNTASNRIQIGHGSGARAFISAGGATQMSQALASVVFSNNTASKVSLAYLLNNGNAAANGTLGTLDTAMTIPVVTQAQIGGLTASLLPLNGTVRQIVYYPRRLTDAELQAITS
jgi:hypothetical protein